MNRRGRTRASWSWAVADIDFESEVNEEHFWSAFDGLVAVQKYPNDGRTSELKIELKFKNFNWVN